MIDQETIEAIDRHIHDRNVTPDENLLDAFFEWLDTVLTEDRLASLEVAAADCLSHSHHNTKTYAALRLFLCFAKARNG